MALVIAATSVPDTILSYRDAIGGQYDAVANDLGSNIFDVRFALGLPLMIYCLINGPISMSPETIENITELLMILLISTVVAFVIYIVGPNMGTLKAILLPSIYVVFTIFIAYKAWNMQWALDFGNICATWLARFFID